MLYPLGQYSPVTLSDIQTAVHCCCLNWLLKSRRWSDKVSVTCRELEKQLIRAKEKAEAELGATGSSKVKFYDEGQENHQSLRALSKTGSLHYYGQWCIFHCSRDWRSVFTYVCCFICRLSAVQVTLCQFVRKSVNGVICLHHFRSFIFL